METIDTSPRQGSRLAPVLGLLPVAAGAVMMASELIERLSGGFTNFSYAVTTAAFLLLAASVWVPERGQRPPAGRSSLLGAATLSAGLLLLAVADIVGFGEPTEESLQAATGPLVPIGGVLMVVGGLLFGVSVIRTKIYPRWTGVLVAVTPLFLPATSAGLPIPVLSLTNSLLGLGIAAMGWQIYRRTR